MYHQQIMVRYATSCIKVEMDDTGRRFRMMGWRRSERMKPLMASWDPQILAQLKDSDFQVKDMMFSAEKCV